MVGQEVEEGDAFFFAAACGVRDTHDGLGIEVVAGLLKEVGVVRHRPAGEDAGSLSDVELVVATVHPDGVKLHDLAGVVVVPAEDLVVDDFGFEVDAIVEVVEHRRRFGRFEQHRAEVAQEVGQDRDVLVVADHAPADRFDDLVLLQRFGRDVEVVEPELEQCSFELASRRDITERLVANGGAGRGDRGQGPVELFGHIRGAPNGVVAIAMPHALPIAQAIEHVLFLLAATQHDPHHVRPRASFVLSPGSTAANRGLSVDHRS